MLVSRLPDRHALALLVRAALRNEVAQVELDAGPQRAEAHTLDLHVSGQPPLALLAEPAGNPQNGTFPLRLRPLYRAQAPQLYALLAAENVSLEGPTESAPATVADPKPPTQPLPTRTLAMKQHDPSNPARVQIRRTTPQGSEGDAPRFASQSIPRSEPVMQAAAANMNVPRPLPPRHPSTVNQAGPQTQPGLGSSPGPGMGSSPGGGDVRRTAPSASWGNPVANDPRRTIPSSSWSQRQQAPGAAPPEPELPPTDDDPHGADADDPSLSVSVVFEPEDIPIEIQVAAAKAQARSGDTAAFGTPPVTMNMMPTPIEPISPATLAEQAQAQVEVEEHIDVQVEAPRQALPADVEEPSLSVSVVFEPDALPAGITAGIPSPLGDDGPATVAEVPPSEGSPNTIAQMSPMDGLSIDLDAGDDDEIRTDAGIATNPGIEIEVAAETAEAEAPLTEDESPATPADDFNAATPSDDFNAAPSDDFNAAAPADDFNGFFDDALANFPSAASPEEVPPEDDELAGAMAAIDAIDSVQMVAAPPAAELEEMPTDDVESGGTQAMAHAPVATLEDFPDLGDLPEPEPALTLGEPLDADFDINATQFPTDAELQIIEGSLPPSGEIEMRGAIPVPPPEDDDSDEDATLIRLPPKPGAKKPTEPVVRPEQRDKKEHTPTKETEIGVQETQVPPESQRNRDEIIGPKPARRAPQESVSDADTAALKKAPVPPPSPSSDPHDPNDPAIGRRIAEGKYVIESLIGAGAAGAVYRATHRELRRTVAIKLLHPHYQQDPHFMTSFRGEALAASQLDHPNVMRVLDFGQEPDGLVYIVMEFLSGRTLQQRLDEERRLPTEKAVEVMIQVCAALSVAHDHGIIHRDIKPDNIMLVPSRNDEGTTFELVKVCDFGIAALQNPRAEDADLSANEHVIAGTPEYMSPEQAKGAPVDARADVYACGICLYELVTGRPPFLGNNAAEILIKQIDEAPQPPSAIVKGLDPIIEEIILRAIQKDQKKRHQSAREMRVELKELIDPGTNDEDDEDELSIVENVAVLDDPASGFPGFFIAFSSAVLRFGRFERGHTDSAAAMKELQKQVRVSLRGRSELTFARRDSGKTPGFVVMSGTAEIVDLKRLLGSQLMGSFGEPFVNELVKKGIASLTLREGIPDVELHYLIEMLLGPFAHEDLRKELLSKPLRNISLLFVSDVVGRDRKLSWKVGLCAARLARDLRALCNIRGISLKKMREIRDELIGSIARLLTRGDEVKQFIFNADLVDEAVANLRGFSSFNVAPLIIDRILHESCAEAATLLLHDLDAASLDEQERLRPFLALFAQRLVTERSPKSDAAVAEFYRRKIISEDDMPRDLKEQIRAASLADALVRDPAQFLRALDAIREPQQYAEELSILETAMSTLARRAEAVPLMAVMTTLSHHAKGTGTPREKAALRTMKWMIDEQRLAPIAGLVLNGPPHQQVAARQLIVLAGSVGVSALYAAREQTQEASARTNFVQAMRDAGPAGWSFMAQVLPRLEAAGDQDLVEDLLRSMPDRPDAVLGDAVARFLPHAQLRQIALQTIVPLWGERAKKPLMEALEHADEPTRVIALAELRKLHAIDEYVFSVVERFLTMKGSAGEDLRVAAAAALTDASAPVRVRAIQLLTKAVEGKRGLVALIRGTGDNEETASVLEAMGRSLLALDRNEGMKALKGRVSRSEGATKQRLAALLQS